MNILQVYKTGFNNSSSYDEQIRVEERCKNECLIYDKDKKLRCTCFVPVPPKNAIVINKIFARLPVKSMMEDMTWNMLQSYDEEEDMYEIMKASDETVYSIEDIAKDKKYSPKIEEYEVHQKYFKKIKGSM